MSKKKKRIIEIIAVIGIVVGIGGKLFMDKQIDNEKKASIKIQTQVADYLYRNYKLVSRPEKESEELEKKFNEGEGGMSLDEFRREARKLRRYTEIKKIEFTNIYIDSMGSINLEFTINNTYEDYTILSTINIDTNDWEYQFHVGSEVNGYSLYKKDKPSLKSMPKELISYYQGRIK